MGLYDVAGVHLLGWSLAPRRQRLGDIGVDDGYELRERR
jgi:hypothetical protein